jgi:type VI secretion system secreted protein VgrG
VSKTTPPPHSDQEIYDYPGEYRTTGDGDGYARARIEELHTRFHQTVGRTNAGGLATGDLFTLENYARDDQNAEHLIISASLDLANPTIQTGRADAQPTFDMTFRSIPSDQRFVSARTTRKPIINGPQTAVVTGPSGEEIHTDEHGRVKVQFHWDRYGENDENTSCWLRVSQIWAGRQWGAVHIPRIGHEVIVEFEEGDPDRPMVTGRVYHGQNQPPYTLPDNKTQSGIKSRSTKGGGADNFNELRFEDKAGEEQVYLQAEKDHQVEIENDQTVYVMNNREKTVDNDETNHIVNNRTENVDGNEEITIGADRTETVQGDEDLSVGSNRTENIGVNEDRTVGVGFTEEVGGSLTQNIGGSLTQNVTGGITITCQAAVTITAAGGLTVVAPGGVTWSDSFWQKSGAMNNEIHITKRALVQLQMEAVSLNVAAVNNKFETCMGVALDTTLTEMKAEGTKLESWGQFLETGLNNMKTVANMIFG